MILVASMLQMGVQAVLVTIRHATAWGFTAALHAQ
jgi:hypothetical protein